MAIRASDFVMEDVLWDNIVLLHGWYWRKSSIPFPPKDQMNWSPFFTCFVEGTNGGQHVHHHNINVAKIEAERLSGQPHNVGKKVYVMKAVAYCKSTKPEVKWND